MVASSPTDYANAFPMASFSFTSSVHSPSNLSLSFTFFSESASAKCSPQKQTSIHHDWITILWLAKNMSKKMEKSITANGPGLIGMVLNFSIWLAFVSIIVYMLLDADKGSFGVSALNTSSNVVNPDATQMLVYHPGQKSGPVLLTNSAASGLLSITSGMPVFEISSFGVGGTNAFDVMLKGAPALVAFIANLPAVEDLNLAHNRTEQIHAYILAK